MPSINSEIYRFSRVGAEFKIESSVVQLFCQVSDAHAQILESLRIRKGLLSKPVLIIFQKGKVSVAGVISGQK